MRLFFFLTALATIILLNTTVCKSQATSITVAAGQTYNLPSSPSPYVTGSVTVNEGGVLNITGNELNCSQTIIKGGRVNIYSSGILRLAGTGSIDFNQPSENKRGELYLSNASFVYANNINMGTFTQATGSTIGASNGSTVNLTGSITAGTGSIISAGYGGKITLNNGDFNLSNDAQVSLYYSSVFSIRNLYAASPGIIINVSQSTFSVLAQTSISGKLKLDQSDLLQGGNLIISSPGTIECISQGRIKIKGDLNNSGGPTYNPYPAGSKPIVMMEGQSDQSIMGAHKLYDLTLTGNSNKKIIAGDVEVSDVLNIGNSELSIPNNSLYLTNSSPSSLVRGTGFISTGEYSGGFKRNMIGIQEFLFPVGSSTTKYRPMIIIPKAATVLGTFAVRYVDGLGSSNPPASQYNTTTLVGSTTPLRNAVNPNFIHKVDKLSTATLPVDIVIFYIPGTDGTYTTIAQKSVTLWQWDEVTNGNPAPVTYSGYTGIESNFAGVRINDYNSFSGTTSIPFVLANNKDALIPQPFAVMKRKLDGGYYLMGDGNLYFKFEEEYNRTGNTSLQYNLFDTKRISQTLPANTVTQGDNWYSVNLPSTLTEGYYTLEVFNTKNERWYLRVRK